VRADSAAYQAANNGSDGLRPLKSPGDLLNIVSLKWRNHATMETAVDKICETCRYWSELAMRSPGRNILLRRFALIAKGRFIDVSVAAPSAVRPGQAGIWGLSMTRTCQKELMPTRADEVPALGHVPKIGIQEVLTGNSTFSHPMASLMNFTIS
jgi:hypothetical protein